MLAALLRRLLQNDRILTGKTTERRLLPPGLDWLPHVSRTPLLPSGTGGSPCRRVPELLRRLMTTIPSNIHRTRWRLRPALETAALAP